MLFQGILQALLGEPRNEFVAIDGAILVRVSGLKHGLSLVLLDADGFKDLVAKNMLEEFLRPGDRSPNKICHFMCIVLQWLSFFCRSVNFK